jgi:hypothetical protein
LVVDKSDLWVVDSQVLDPKPDSVIVTLKSKVDLKLALPARIEPLTFHLFIRKDGYGPDYPYVNLPIPGQTIKGNYTLGVSENFTPLLNQTSWVEFVREIVFQKETTLSLNGVTNAYLGVLKSHVTLNKDVTVPGKLICLLYLNPCFSKTLLYPSYSSFSPTERDAANYQ